MSKHVVTARIEYKGKALFSATNTTKTHPLQFYYKSNPYSMSTHAEVAVISKYLKEQNNRTHKRQRPLPLLSYCELIITRRSKNGKLALAKPCRGCERLLKDYDLGIVWFSVGNNSGYEDEYDTL